MVELAGLGQRQPLEHLIEGAETTGHHHETLAVLHEHHLAHEEVAEVDTERHVLVHPGLEGQLDAEPHRDAVGFVSALVGGLHHPGSAPGDDAEPGLDEFAGQFLGRGVDRIVRFGPGRTEDRDRRAEFGELAEALDELGLDPHDAPRVLVNPCHISAGREQALIGGGGQNHVPGAQHRTLTMTMTT